MSNSGILEEIQNAILNAIVTSNLTLLDRLIESKLNTDLGSGMTPLFIAVTENHIDVIRYLLEHGADPNIPNVDGETALSYASGNNYTEIVKLLLEHGANPKSEDMYGGTALSYASENGHTEIVKLLLEHGADPNIRNNDGIVPLMVSSEENKPKIVKLLLEHGADPNIKNKIGGTALIIASQLGHTEIIKLLLDRGADPNIKDTYGSIPLMFASKFGHTETIKLLLEHGADPNIRNNLGKTAINFSKTPAIRKLLTLGRIPKNNRSVPQSNLPTECFDPIMASHYGINTQEGMTYFYITNREGRVHSVKCLDMDSLEHYMTSGDYIFYKCKDHVPLSALNIRRNRNIEATAYHLFNFDIRIFLSEDDVIRIVPGKKYILRPIGPIGRIVSKSIVEGGSAVSGVHCGPATGDEVYSVHELVVSAAAERVNTGAAAMGTAAAAAVGGRRKGRKTRKGPRKGVRKGVRKAHKKTLRRR